MNWLIFFIGLLIGWLVQWVLDYFFWRQSRQQAAEAQANLEKQLTNSQTDLATAKTDLTTVQEKLADCEAKANALSAQVATPKADDLDNIEGIGPKIADILNKNGILSYQQLANARVDDLKSILAKAGSRYKLANPETWPEQARLAANRDWDALDTLQKNLSGGRRKQ